METLRLDFPGGSVATNPTREGEQTVVVIGAGPRARCNYMHDEQKHNAEQGCRAVVWERVGTGRPERNDHAERRTMPRFFAAPEALRSRLNLGSINMVGRS